MDIEQFRRAGYRAIDHICDYYYSLRNTAVVPQVEPGYLRRALPSTAPQKGEDFEKIAQDYNELIIPGVMHWQHPRFFAYFPLASSFEAILGDLYATAIGHNPGFNWSVAPACTELEAVVLDWAAEMFSLDVAFHNTSGVGGGVIQTSASDSALMATVAARSRFLQLHPDVPTEKLVLYTTTQTHSLGKKTGLVLGLKVRALEVTAEDNYGLRGTSVKRALAEDAISGMFPFILIATVGTTSSGAIDHIGEIGEIVAAIPSLWLHIDAAWAGLSMACPEYRDLCMLDDINKYADSICTNFHKLGLVTFDCSTLWIRDRKCLTDALDVTPEFLRSKHSDAGTVIDYRNWHQGLARRFRAPKLWFVLRSYGVQGFQEYIHGPVQPYRRLLPYARHVLVQTVKLGETFTSLIKQSPHLRLVTRPCLSLTVFRLEHPTRFLEPEQLNALNRAFHTRLSVRRDVAFTQTDLNGIICIRCAVGTERTEEADILWAYEVLCEEANKTLGAWNRERTDERHGKL